MLAQVSQVTDKFILRRTNRLNARFLPPKQIYNVPLDTFTDNIKYRYINLTKFICD